MQQLSAPHASGDESSNPTTEKRPTGITWRALSLGCILIPPNVFWVLQMERVMYGPYPSQLPICANVVFVLAVLLALNRGVCRLAPRFAFSQAELLVLWTMLTISTGIAGIDGIPILNGIIGHGTWFASKSNGWNHFLPAFPSWLVITNRSVLRGFYLGNSSFYRAAILKAWLRPICFWTLFVVLVLWCANCINVLLRRQWADSERLTFPVVWLPMEMTEDGTGKAFFGSRLMWAGFAVAAGLTLWNGIAFLYPSLPAINVGVVDLKPFFTVKPWDGIDWTPITFYPLVIGLGFLLPLDLLFSCWFFYIFWKMQLVVTRAMAWDADANFPYAPEQGFGALMGLFCFYIWSGRKAYAAIWRSALSRGGGRDEVAANGAHEALSPRMALLGLVAGLCGIIIFCLAADVTPWVIAAWLGIYLAIIIVVTRVRAEVGSPVHDFHFMGPDAMIPRITGMKVFSQHDMAFMTFGYSFTRAHRSDTMPAGMEGLQMARLRGMQARRMLGAIMLAVLIGTLATFWASETQAYRLGAASKMRDVTPMPQEALNRMSQWVGATLNPRPSTPAMMAMAVGFLCVITLFVLRLRFFGFPLHPLGYAIASSWAINLVWMPLFIAWALKLLCMRYGGLRTYRRYLPFFLGLILGDCIMGSIWGLASLALGMRTYNFFGA
ncbi:MAG: hypothetical protein KGJ62_11465 [Armatimonadetes bacterium]|nr:hypothetical protein [Armatimonadota bacterium]MDE2206479.1 hypothetical protein [Armatimonadota bacterium]